MQFQTPVIVLRFLLCEIGIILVISCVKGRCRIGLVCG